MDSKYYFQEQFKIRSSEVDIHGKARLQSICNLLQEVAGNHALALNFDISQLMEKDLTWVLHRLHVVMGRLPDWRETITIKTWPSSGDTLRAYRDFQIFGEDGNEIGRSLSYWLMLNIKSRRPVRMPDEILEMAPTDVEHVLDIKSNRLSPLEKRDYSTEFKVRRSDLDMNNHVNNVKYIGWALETLPEEIKIKEIDIEFQAECLVDDFIFSESRGDKDGKYIHQLSKKENSKIVALAETKPFT
ncbi:MAG: thioesterase [Balneolaceae bacterium]|nr:thioesterase [Balneolaceae bacterium]